MKSKKKGVSVREGAYSGRSRAGRVMKFYSYAAAAEHIGELSKECEIFGLTKGQFSLANILEVILDKTGAAHVVIATWTTSSLDTERTREFLSNGNIKSLKWIIDRSFEKRNPESCQLLCDLFGDCIRTIRTHAKFLLIYNDDWSFVVRTSMNFNANPRVETFEISEDKEFLEYMLSYVDSVFESQSVAENFDSRSPLDKLPALNDHELAAPAQTGEPSEKALTMYQLKYDTLKAELDLKTERAIIEKIKRQKLQLSVVDIKDVKKEWIETLTAITKNCCSGCKSYIKGIIETIK